MKQHVALLTLILSIGLCARIGAQMPDRKLSFTLQTRAAESNEPTTETIPVNARHVGVVIVDPWNYHWCMTACERVAAMAPRWNRAVECARRLGMPIIWVPSDVIGSYSGWPQRERALAVELEPVPEAREMLAAQFTAPIGRCMCGPGVSCHCNYGHDAMTPGLVIGEEDFIASSTEEVYTLLKQRGITHVIYLGLHTNMCLYGKPGALKFMYQAGLQCMLARDINDAFTCYDPDSGYTPDQGTRQIDEDLERAGVPTINIVEEWRKAGVWNDEWVVETVRITPWGKPDRPYFFEKDVVVTLTAPWLDDVEIRYTLDGSEPAADSLLYEDPLRLGDTRHLKTAAFRNGRLVSVATSAYFVRLPPRPPKPDVYLDDLEYISDPYTKVGEAHAACFWHPKVGVSYEGEPLRVRATAYEKGLGFRAPSSVRYALTPEYERFVALAGIADNMLDYQLGRNLAMHCSVVFRVIVDGETAAESPVMRISQEPWRFDVRIPKGSRFINLVCMDAGSRNILDLGNWVDAGFALKKTEE